MGSVVINADFKKLWVNAWVSMLYEPAGMILLQENDFKARVYMKQ